MKTSEQMADEYADSEGSGNETYEHGLRQGFLAGYQAALDQLADAGKVMNSPEKLDGWISVKDRLPEDK